MDQGKAAPLATDAGEFLDPCEGLHRLFDFLADSTLDFVGRGTRIRDGDQDDLELELGKRLTTHPKKTRQSADHDRDDQEVDPGHMLDSPANNSVHKRTPFLLFGHRLLGGPHFVRSIADEIRKR